MTDGEVRRSGRARRQPKILYDVYSNVNLAADEAPGLQPTADVENPARSEDAVKSQRQRGRPKADRERSTGAVQEANQALRQQHGQSPQSEPANEQRAEQPEEAPEYQLSASTVVQERKAKQQETAVVAKVSKAPTKRKRVKYDPAPMKAVAEHAQNILEPVSQTAVPAAVNPCAALNCRPSAPLR